MSYRLMLVLSLLLGIFILLTAGSTAADTEECGTRRPVPRSIDSLIVGGTRTTPGAWPWQVSVQLFSYGWVLDRCGGAILNKRWVVTAAHCLYDISENVDIYIGFALTDKDMIRESYHMIPDRIIIHENYTGRAYKYNDIALLHMPEDILYDAEISSICLPTTSVQEGDICTATGYGMLESDGSDYTVPTNNLYEVELSILGEECVKSRGGEWIPYKQFCSGATRGLKGICAGDSGGPLSCLGSDGKWQLQGITSMGPSYCGLPLLGAIFTDVIEFKSWIEDKIVNKTKNRDNVTLRGFVQTSIDTNQADKYEKPLNNSQDAATPEKKRRKKCNLKSKIINTEKENVAEFKSWTNNTMPSGNMSATMPTVNVSSPDLGIILEPSVNYTNQETKHTKDSKRSQDAATPNKKRRKKCNLKSTLTNTGKESATEFKSWNEDKIDSKRVFETSPTVNISSSDLRKTLNDTKQEAKRQQDLNRIQDSRAKKQRKRCNLKSKIKKLRKKKAMEFQSWFRDEIASKRVDLSETGATGNISSSDSIKTLNDTMQLAKRQLDSNRSQDAVTPITSKSVKNVT